MTPRMTPRITRADGLRVLQLTDFYPPVLGGLERVVADLSASLARRGAEVVVGTLSAAPRQEPGVPVQRLGSTLGRLPGAHSDGTRPFHPPFPDPLTVRDLHRLVADVRPDVVHVHSWILNSWLPLRRCWPATRTVAYAHDYGLFCPRKTDQRTAEGPGCGTPGALRCARCAAVQYGPVRAAALGPGLRAMRRATRSVDALVAVSSAVADTLASALDVARPVVIPPAVDLVTDPDPPRPDVLPPGPYVLYVGQLAPHKGVDVLLDAVRSVPGLQLVVLGLPKEGWTPPRDPAVTVLTDVPHDVVMAAWRHAAVGAVPSRWADPMPLVTLEAMAQGCPLVASRVGGLVDAVDDGVTGVLVPPGDATALAAALDRIVRDPDLRHRMGTAARARSAAFHLDAVTDRWIELYTQLTGERAGEVRAWR